MVEATNDSERIQTLIVKAFNQIQFLPPTDKGERGAPQTPNEGVSALIKAKGKDFCADAKKAPADVKSAQGKNPAEEEGFSGQKIGDAKTGKAKQWYKDGSYFDGFMLDDELVRGRFYHTNGDFYQGKFNKRENGALLSGTYTQGGDVKAELKQETSFEDGLPAGKVEIVFVIEDTPLSLLSMWENGKPDGMIKVKVKDAAVPDVESPWKKGVLDQKFESLVVKPVAKEDKLGAALDLTQTGTLRLTVVQAKLTRSTEYFGNMDPFVKIESGEQKFKSSTVQEGGDHPKWTGQTFSVDVKSPGDDLHLSVWDEDTGNNDLVGECTIKLSALIGSSKGVDEWFEIQHGGKKAGTINLLTKFKDSADPDSDDDKSKQKKEEIKTSASDVI